MARQAGYEIVIRLRLPVDQKDIDDNEDKIAVMKQAIAGNLTALLRHPDTVVRDFTQTFTSWNDGTGRAAEKDSDDDQGDTGGDTPALGISALPFRRAAKSRQAARH